MWGASLFFGIHNNTMVSTIKEARLNPYKYFSEHNIKDVLRDNHPDLGGNKDIFQEFQSLFEKTKEEPPKIGKWTIVQEVGVGDISNIYRTEEGFILKRLRVKAKSLLRNESKLIQTLKHKIFAEWVEDGKDFLVSKSIPELYSLSEIRQQYSDLDPRHVGWIFKRILAALSFIHSHDYSHNAVTPEHILVGPLRDEDQIHGIQMLGLIHTDKEGQPIKVVPAIRKDWYEKKTGSFTQDIQMAAQSILFLESKLPKKLDLFFKGVLISRNLEATNLYKEFESLLFRVFGPPNFVHLKMR